jgi:hypothetical protein
VVYQQIGQDARAVFDRSEDKIDGFGAGLVFWAAAIGWDREEVIDGEGGAAIDAKA